MTERFVSALCHRTSRLDIQLQSYDSLEIQKVTFPSHHQTYCARHLPAQIQLCSCNKPALARVARRIADAYRLSESGRFN